MLGFGKTVPLSKKNINSAVFRHDAVEIIQFYYPACLEKSQLMPLKDHNQNLSCKN